MTILFHSEAHSCSSKGKRALAHIVMLQQVLEHFKLREGRYLTNEEGLLLLVEKTWGTEEEEKFSYLKRLPYDPWGNPYEYRYPGTNNPEGFDIWTYGADGVQGGDGANADCGNWHDGNCYEPTVNKNKLLVSIIVNFANPVFWIAFYLGHTLYLKKEGMNLKTAMRGWHLKALLLSFPIFFTLLSLVY